MPAEPPATTWSIERPPADHPHDVWAIGADLEPGTLLAAYRLGLFPMPVDGELVWWSPEERAVIPVAGLRAVTLAAPSCPGLRDPRRHRVRRGDRGSAPIRAGRTAGSTRTSSRLHAAARARLGALGRGVGRGGARGRPLRRRDRRALRGRVEVLPPQRSVEGGAARARRAASRQPAARGVVDVQWATPHLALARRGRGAAGGVPPAAATRRSLFPTRFDV